MAKQRQKGQGAFRLWLESNQKVIWVVLLILIAPLFAFTGPFTDFITRRREDQPVDRFFGETMTVADRNKLHAELDVAYTLGATANQWAEMADYTRPAPAPFVQSFLLQAEAAASYFVYRKKALDMGLRVSDQELSDHIRDLWQWMEAYRRASEEVAAKYPSDPAKDAGKDDRMKQAEQFQRVREASDLAKRKKAELEAARAFDPTSWGNMISAMAKRSETRAGRMQSVEETLRGLYLVSKLEDYVRSAVQVTPDEAYAEYREENQNRRLSWVELESPPALREKVAAGLQPDDIRRHYDENKIQETFKKPLSIRAPWLLVPREHFRAQAEKTLTEDDFKKHYEATRNDYRRGTILGEEALFNVRTKEASSKLTSSLYKPYEEVKEEVRKKALDKRAEDEMLAAAQKLRTRVTPDRPPGQPAAPPPTPALFDGLVKEFPFLKTGMSGWVDRETAEKTFGDGYSRQVMNWLNTAANPRPGQPLDLKPPPMAMQGDKGMVFYGKPEVRQPAVPSFADIQDEVREALVKGRAVELIQKAASAVSAEVNEGKKDLAKVAETGIDVSAGKAEGAETVHVAASPLRTTSGFVGKYGPIMVPKAKEEAPADAKEEPKKAEDKPEEEPHPSSRDILSAAARIKEIGKTAVAADPMEAAAYIVRLDDRILPDPSGFESQRPDIERDLRREKEEAYLNNWRKEVMAEARGRKPSEGEEPAAGAANPAP